MTKIKPLSFFSKKIAVSIVLILMFISLFTLAENTSANTTIWFSQQHLTTDLSFNSGGTMGFGAVAGNNGFLVSASFYFDVASAGSGTLTAYLALSQNVNGTYNPITGVSWIQKSNTIAIDSNMANFINDNGWLQFNFGGNVNLTVSNQYDIYVVNDGVTIKCRVGSSSASFIYFGGSWGSTSSSAPACIVFADTTLSSTPTPQPNSGSVAVNFFVNNGTDTYHTPLVQGNLTWGILYNQSLATTMFIGNNGGTPYINDGTWIILKPVLENGWYFTNFTLVTDTGVDNFTYKTNSWAFQLLSERNTVYNFTMYISQQHSTVNIALQDSTHGEIYFQNYVDSIPSGVKYGANTYAVTYGTVLYISTIPDSGYKTDYFTVQNNGLTSLVSGSYLTFIAMSDSTITPHYVISSSTGVTGGTGSIWSFLSSFTWQDIAILVIYSVLCGLCTYLFAFTGLIAGLNIATVICFVMGLLGSLMYPVLGLVIIADIALIIMGSGLLNRTKKDSGN
jgi:hypothetical protein